MRAVTVQMPWAWALAYNHKPVENRGRVDPWRSAVGEVLGIHAGKTWDDDALYDPRICRALIDAFPTLRETTSLATYRAILQSTVLPQLHELDGKLLSARRLRGLHDHTASDCRCGGWAESGQFHLVFGLATTFFEPTPLRGYQGLWTLPLDLTEIPRITPAGAR